MAAELVLTVISKFACTDLYGRVLYSARTEGDKPRDVYLSLTDSWDKSPEVLEVNKRYRITVEEWPLQPEPPDECSTAGCGHHETLHQGPDHSCSASGCLCEEYTAPKKVSR
jgi:hypothetical protein